MPIASTMTATMDGRMDRPCGHTTIILVYDYAYECKFYVYPSHT